MNYCVSIVNYKEEFLKLRFFYSALKWFYHNFVENNENFSSYAIENNKVSRLTNVNEMKLFMIKLKLFYDYKMYSNCVKILNFLNP